MSRKIPAGGKTRGDSIVCINTDRVRDGPERGGSAQAGTGYGRPPARAPRRYGRRLPMRQTHSRWDRMMGGILAVILATLLMVFIVMAAIAFGV